MAKLTQQQIRDLARKIVGQSPGGIRYSELQAPEHAEFAQTFEQQLRARTRAGALPAPQALQQRQQRGARAGASAQELLRRQVLPRQQAREVRVIAALVLRARRSALVRLHPRIGSLHDAASVARPARPSANAGWTIIAARGRLLAGYSPLGARPQRLRPRARLRSRR